MPTPAPNRPIFTALAIWFQQVDNLDACIKHLLYGSQIFKLRGVAMDGISTGTVELLHAVDRVAHYVIRRPLICVPIGMVMGPPSGCTVIPLCRLSVRSIATVCRVFTNVLLYLYNQSFAVLPFYFQCVVNTLGNIIPASVPLRCSN